LTGTRIARGARLRISTAAAVFDADRRLLLTRRRDNGRWCLPGGSVEPGESVSEACIREVVEETGLLVALTRLIGVYSSPDRVFTYPDGNRWHVIELVFSARISAGAIRQTPEVERAAFFTREESENLDLLEHDRARLPDTFSDLAAAFVR
jgi:8-oxo-dGTP pyrophosphatase MutT (NUDIX family)